MSEVRVSRQGGLCARQRRENSSRRGDGHTEPRKTVPGRAGRRARHPRRWQEASERSGRQGLFRCLMGDGGKLRWEEKPRPGCEGLPIECQTKMFGQGARERSFEKQMWPGPNRTEGPTGRPCSSPGEGDGHTALGRTIASEAWERKDEQERGRVLGEWKCQSLSRVRLFVTPRTVARQAPLSMGFSRHSLEWVAISFSGASSWPRDRTHVSCIAGRFFTIWAIREAQGVGNEGRAGVTGWGGAT